MPRGATAKREKKNHQLKRKFKKSTGYKGQEEDISTRIVNKQRVRLDETRVTPKKDKDGKSPDRELPIKNYPQLTITEVKKRLGRLSKSDLKKVSSYETKHKNRKTLMEVINRLM